MGLAQKEKNYNRLISTGASMAKRINRPVVWNVLNPMSSSQNTKKADKCGFGCKIKKFGSKVRSQYAHSQYERGAKRASGMGLSFSEYQTARVSAEKKGRERAEKERKKAAMKQIEQAAYWSGGGTKGKNSNSSKMEQGWAAFDAFLGAKPARKRRKAPKRRVAPYQKAAPKRRAAPRKRRAAPREEPFFTW